MLTLSRENLGFFLVELVFTFAISKAIAIGNYRVFQINCNFIKRYNFFLRRDKYTIFSAQDR